MRLPGQTNANCGCCVTVKINIGETGRTPGAAKRLATISTWLLAIGVVFWGATFVLMKEAVDNIDVYSYLSVRFFISAGLLAAIFPRSLARITRETFLKGALIGSMLAVSFITQSIGMQHTTASNSAFITGLYIVFVPLSVIALDRRLPSPMQSAAILLAFTGLAFITVKPGLRIGIGDIWTFACAVAFGIHVVMIGRLVHNIDGRAFAIVQMGTVAVITLAAGLITNGRIEISGNYLVWRSIIFCAIFAGAFMYTVQALFQRHISEIKAVIIYSLEPLFGALIAVIMLGERITPAAMLGGALIMSAMVLSDLKMGNKT